MNEEEFWDIVLVMGSITLFFVLIVWNVLVHLLGILSIPSVELMLVACPSIFCIGGFGFAAYVWWYQRR